MRSFMSKGVLLAGATLMTMAAVAQQQPTSLNPHKMTADIAVTFNLEHGQVAQPTRDGFWLKGASVEGSVAFWRGLGVGANLTGEHIEHATDNLSLGKTAFMAGPHYTFGLPSHIRSQRTQLFAESLFGAVHGFDSTFPVPGGLRSSANTFSMQMGGGLDVALKHGFGLRAPELDWVHSALPNNASNSQNGLRIAFGVSYRR